MQTPEAVPAQETPPPAGVPAPSGSPPVLQVQLTLFADGGVQLAAGQRPDPVVLLGLLQSIAGQVTAEIAEELLARRRIMAAAGHPLGEEGPAIVVAKPGDERGLAAAFARMKGDPEAR